MEPNFIPGAASGSGGLAVDGAHIYWTAPTPELQDLFVTPHTFIHRRGRRVRGRCVPPTRANRRNRACTRPIALPGHHTTGAARSTTFHITR